MVLDVGLILYGEDVIVIGGMFEGVDIVVIIRFLYVVFIFEIKIKEIICKFYEF